MIKKFVKAVIHLCVITVMTYTYLVLSNNLDVLNQPFFLLIEITFAFAIFILGGFYIHFEVKKDIST